MHKIQKMWQLTIVYNGLDSVNFQHKNLKKPKFWLYFFFGIKCNMKIYQMGR